MIFTWDEFNYNKRTINKYRANWTPENLTNGSTLSERFLEIA